MADWHCPNCDFKNSDNSKTCISCGAERPGTEINIGAKEWECPKCGHKNSPDHTVCFSCGTPRSGSSEARTASGTKVSGKTAFICIAAALVIFVGVSAKNTGRKSTDTYSRTSVSTSAKPAYTTAETKKSYAYDYTPNYTQRTSSDSAALRTAKAYLAVMPFSHDGLIEQLEYEGYSHSDAKAAADNCGADWKEQAVLKAKDYLEYSSFSRDGLIDQLEYEKFTRSEAEYAADYCGIDTGSEACEQAKSYLRYSAFSKQGLIEQLEYEGYSTAEATEAVEKCGADWNRQAELKAEQYVEYMDFSYSELVDQLEYEGFTHSQAAHGAEYALY